MVSLTGTWMQRVGQDWLVLRLTHNSGTAIGITTGLQFLPFLIVSPYGGTLADHYSKRALLVMTQAAMALQAVALASLDLLHMVTIAQVYVLALLLGVVSAIDNPTRQAFVSELVGHDQVVNAVGLNSATFNSAQIFGPAVAGLLIDAIGTGWVFALNAFSYVAIVGSLLMIRRRELFSLPEKADKIAAISVSQAVGEIREGFRYLRGRTELLVPIVLIAAIGTLSINFPVTLALMDKVAFHKGAGGYGVLSSCLAVGSLGGALIAARRTQPTLRLLVGVALAFGLVGCLEAFMPSYVTLALILVPLGFAYLTFSTACNSMLQLHSDPVLRGRVMGVYMLAFCGGYALASPFVGWIAQTAGPRAAILLGGVTAVAAAAGAAWLQLRQREPRLESLLGRRPAQLETD